MISYEFMDENNLVVDRRREGIRQCEKMILGIVFNGTDKGGLLFRREGLIVCYFLEATKNVRAMCEEDVNLGLHIKLEKD